MAIQKNFSQSARALLTIERSLNYNTFEQSFNRSTVVKRKGERRMCAGGMFCDCDVIHAGAVEAVRAQMPEENELYTLADLFKVFGDSTRVRILCALHAGELCVCDLAALLNMTKSAISHQLRQLKQANLVKYRREGKNVFYALSDEHVHIIFEKGLEHIREEA